MNAFFMKREIQTCLRVIAPKLKRKQIQYAVSWPKYKIIDLFNVVVNKRQVTMKIVKRIIRKTPKSLKKLCQHAVSSLPKTVLNIIYAEYIFPERLQEWRSSNPFVDNLRISGVHQSIIWYCKPEYIAERFMQQFAFIDPHHLLTNARVKCCKTGIAERKLYKAAWIRVARHSNTTLNIALVENLVDRQSDEFAETTFSESVEQAMIKMVVMRKPFSAN